MPGGQDGRDSGVRQENKAERDVYAGGRDVHVTNYSVVPGSVPAPGADRPLVVGDVPQQPPGFQPRPDLMAELDATDSGVLVVHAVTGMRGVGKTQLAAAYAREKIGAGWRLVAWVNAEEQGSLAAGLAAVAEAAGLPLRGGADPGLAVRHWLEGDGVRRLLVFDNATDADLLRPYVPAAGGARVVITGNRQSLAALGTKVGVEVFTAAESTAYLAQRTGLTDAAGATAVAAELGCLPLALAQAAAVIIIQRLGYTTYLQRLRAFPLGQYLTREAGQAYPHGVAQAILLSLGTVTAGDETGECNRLLMIMSVLSAAGVRRDMLHAVSDAVVVDVALGRLAEASLVSFSVDGQAVTAHRLVLRVVRDRLAAERLTLACQAAAIVLDRQARTLAGSVDRVAARDVPEQVTALAETVTGLPGEPSAELSAQLLGVRYWALYHLLELGDSTQQAIAVGQSLVADMAKARGANDPDTLVVRSGLAVAYYEAGRIAEAITLHEQMLAYRERALGPDHLHTLQSRNNLAIAYLAVGRTAEAIALHEQTLADRERVLGPDHPNTLQSRNNLAIAREAMAAGESQGAGGESSPARSEK